MVVSIFRRRWSAREQGRRVHKWNYVVPAAQSAQGGCENEAATESAQPSVDSMRIARPELANG
jgi:hypothetical protein